MPEENKEKTQKKRWTLKKVKTRCRTIYWQNFLLTASVVMLTLALLGSAFFALTYSYAIDERSEEMQSKASVVSHMVSSYMESGSLTGLRELADFASSVTDAQFLICNADGNLLLTTDPSLANRVLTVPKDVSEGAMSSEPYAVRTTLGSIYADTHFVVGVPIESGGKMAMLASVGPMGLGAIDYALHCDRRPSLLVITDIDDARLERAQSIYTVEHAKEMGVELHYVNTAKPGCDTNYLRELSGGTGYDDVFVFAPVRPVVEQGDRILGKDGCLNFFAGPTNTEFKAEFNFYNVHYASTHIVGTSGGNTADMIESLELMSQGRLNPAVMVTHIGGLNAVIDTTLNLPKIPGGKKLIYNNINLELTAIADFEEKGKTDPLFAGLAEIMKRSNNLWCAEAEKYLLEHAPKA